VLDRSDDWSDIEFMKLKRDIALATQAEVIRVKLAELRPPPEDTVVQRLNHPRISRAADITSRNKVFFMSWPSSVEPGFGGVAAIMPKRPDYPLPRASRLGN